MSTNINIKKRITILEESAILTKDVNSIDFIGAGVIASIIGEDVTVTIPGGSGNTTYYLNESVTQAPYKEFSSIVTSAIEQVVPLTVAGGVTSVIAEYQTPSGVPGTTQIPGGLWQFFLHFNAGSAGQNWIIRPTVLKRDLGGIETLLFTPDPEIVTGMSTTTTMYVSDGVFPATTLLTTDRIVVRISMQNTTGVSQTVNFRTEGSQHYSVGLTTLNQIIPTGAVTSVTGTAPVVSSGGTTPAISIPQADTLTDGYLSSTDWNTFNNKPDNLSQLNDVDIITTPLGDGEVLTYDGVSGLWKNEPPNSTPTNQVVLFADLATTEALKACTYSNGTLGVGATLIGNVNGQLSTVSFTDRIDNVVTALNQIILVKNQSNQTQNGIYVVTQLGSPTQPFIITRTTDADTQAELYPLQINVFGGATQANLAFLQKTVDPVVGTNNIVFTTTVLGIQNTPVLHVDTVTSAALPACTYTSGANPTLPGSGAFLEANVNGILPAINGVTLTAGRRFLVKDQVNQAHNGTYAVSSVGSASTRWRLTRVDAWGSNFTVLDREWKVNNPSSTKYGARYSTNLLSLANTAIGTTNIIFTEIYSVPTTRNITINGTTQDLSADRTYTVTDANLSTSDITTNDVSTAKHGFAPKAPNDTAKFLRGDGTWAVPSAGGLTNFTEAANSSAPNATVPVNSLTPVTATTNADFAIVPKGSGALLAAIPDGTSTGGNKRGINALDLQMSRSSQVMVASGNFSAILCGSNNMASGANSVVAGSGNSANGSLSFAIGHNNNSTNNNSYCFGNENLSNGVGSYSIGRFNNASGSSAVAIGGSIGTYNTASGTRSVAIGEANTASGTNAIALGQSNISNGSYSFSFGRQAHTFGIDGRQAYASGQEGTSGDAQVSKFILHERTTGNTATTITTNSSAAATNNQVILSDQSAYRFKGSIVGKQSGSVNAAVWDIDGFIVRGANAAATTLNISNVNVIQNTPGWGTPTLAADTTNGGLRVQVTGATATNIQWTAVIDTTEVIYA